MNVVSVPRRIVFLDFDGVLNSTAWHKTRPWPGLALDPTAVKRLNQLNYLDVHYVVSSTWRLDSRYGMDPAPMEALLHAFGFTGYVVGVTPHLRHGRYMEWEPESDGEKPRDYPNRGDEIAAWLAEQPAVEAFVIFDDDSDMGKLSPFLVQTHFELGLQDEHVERAEKILRSQMR